MAYKICSLCNQEAGVRTKICDCGAVFPVKSKREKALKPKGEEIDWKDLRRGDEVKIIAGTGPYYESENGRIYMGLAGKYKVISVEKDGFLVDDGGRAFCYMAEKRQGVVGFREAHKVKLIKRYVDENNSS